MNATAVPITPRQREILAWVASFIEAHGFSPKYRDGCAAFGFKSPNGFVCHIAPLRKRGLLTWVDNSPRTLRVTPEGEEVLNGN